MRGIDLIPPDARRGDTGPMRAGVVSYVLIGALALALLGVIALGFTSKQISDREAEVESLNQELADATQRAESLSAFATFRAIQETRTATVSSLAQSRFDWERVLNELALIIPENVWLTQLGGSSGPGAEVEDGPDISIRDTVPGPALELVGCTTGQDDTAAFVAALEDIDGVTRVGVASSNLPEEDPASTESGATAVSGDSAEQEENDECRTRNFITRFEIVVAFDAVPTPATATSAPGVPAPAVPSTGAASGSLASSGSPPSSMESQASDVPATPVGGG